MDKFLQIHMLTPYAPSNLNRDDLGRPKTALLGGRQRLRISSQSLKRAWRTSEVFCQALPENMGTRTKEMGIRIFNDLKQAGVAEKEAEEYASAIAGVFGKTKSKAKLEIEQLAHFSPEEKDAIAKLVAQIAESGEKPSNQDLNLLRHPENAVDIAMFGRMLASNPGYNVEASLQVAHAITINEASVEDDFFTAVDDLNSGMEDVGAGHMGETEFGAGVFYLYLCLDYRLLCANLGNNEDLAKKSLAAMLSAAATVAPTGKQNSFASRSRAHYILAERGSYQPRSLAAAFLEPVKAPNHLDAGIQALGSTKAKLDGVYGESDLLDCSMNALSGEGSLQEIIDFALEGVQCPNS